MRVDRQRFRLEREVAVPVLVIGSLVVAVVAGVAAGVDRPYPGYALGSGLVLVIERALVIWVAVLLVLIIVDQALRGQLPIEISGRGVRYAAEERVDVVAGANGDLGDRVEALELVVEALERGRSRC